MSLIPVFKIGLWNAWIIELCTLLPIFALTLTPLKKVRLQILICRHLTRPIGEILVFPG